MFLKYVDLWLNEVIKYFSLIEKVSVIIVLILILKESLYAKVITD